MTYTASNLEISDIRENTENTDFSSLQEEITLALLDNSFKFESESKLPEAFASANDLLADFGEETGGNKNKEETEEEPIGGDELIKFAKEEAADGGQLGSGDYAAALGKDMGSKEFKEAVDNLTHTQAMESLETLRGKDSNGRLEESELRRMYSSSTPTQKAAIIYALKNFDNFAKAGNLFFGDLTTTALDKVDLEKAKQPGK